MSAYSDAILALSPQGYWRLGESSGTNADDLGSGNTDGVYTNSPTLGVAGALIGDADTAITLNGSTQYVLVNGTGPGDTMTLSAWVKRSSTGGFNPNIICSKTYTGWEFRFTTADKLQLSRLLDADLLLTAATYTSTTSWYFVVATKSGTAINIYVNGSNAATGTTATTFPTSAGLDIGDFAWDHSAGFFAGSVDEVAVFTTALNSTQIASLYTVGTVLPGFAHSQSAVIL